jgi:hypothetical protein
MQDNFVREKMFPLARRGQNNNSVWVSGEIDVLGRQSL